LRKPSRKKPTIQLLVFSGCPLANAARASLGQALAELQIAGYVEVDLLDPATPAELRAWGSPTILVDGEDVTGGRPGDGIGCRVYEGPDRVPAAATIVASIERRRSGARRSRSRRGR
jgi:hypothetical protein